MSARPGAAGPARVTAAAVAALTAWSLVACGSTSSRSATPGSTSTTAASTTGTRQKPSSKIPAEVQRTVAHLQAGEKPGDANSGFSDSMVPVRGDGKLQLELSAAGTVTAAQKTDLTALGAEIVAAGSTVAIVDAWVPFAKVDEAAALAWVVAVTVPSPTRGR
ncbi:MAG: hypothetical protein ACR2LJ_01375 [Acidimicrobiales bacterium]